MKHLKSLLFVAGLASLIVLLLQPVAVYHFRDYIALLFPKGIIALEERNMLILLQGIMLIVVIPVYIMTFIFAWKYRAGRKTDDYDPDLVDHTIAEFFWWGIPAVITLIICVITWVKTYDLDPYRPIEGKEKALTVQVVALQWQWLFIYPEEQIATTNFLQIPVDRPIRFEITADAPMNSFWIPHLGGQIYAMPKMKSILYLRADAPGDYRGSSANISGDGFAEMHFITRASSPEEYSAWVTAVKNSNQGLTRDVYKALAKPQHNKNQQNYTLQDAGLFDWVVMRYMHPNME